MKEVQNCVSGALEASQEPNMEYNISNKIAYGEN
jgi:hypothetical protein